MSLSMPHKPPDWEADDPPAYWKLIAGIISIYMPSISQEPPDLRRVGSNWNVSPARKVWPSIVTSFLKVTRQAISVPCVRPRPQD